MRARFLPHVAVFTLCLAPACSSPSSGKANLGEGDAGSSGDAGPSGSTGGAGGSSASSGGTSPVGGAGGGAAAGTGGGGGAAGNAGDGGAPGADSGPAGCATNTEDCDGDPSNGCEVRTVSDALNCGACDFVCEGAANATPYCFVGQCRVACTTGWENCNGGTDGCEVDITTDPKNCGACGTDCGAGTCVAGKCQCVATTVTAQESPLDLYIMFDQSLSMTCGVASGGDRWTAVKTALQGFVASTAASGISVGIGYFGDSGLASSCDPTAYETPDVEIAPLPGNAQPISTSLDNHSPSTNTPTAAALSGAINHAITWKGAHPGHAVAVVLVTDGQPNACGTVTDVANVAGAGLTGGTIPTFVIGVISPGTACISDPNPPNQADLDSVALAGGTTEAFMIDVGTNAIQRFQTALTAIKGSALFGCQYGVPPAVGGVPLDLTSLKVKLTSGGSSSDLPKVTDAAACTPAAGGWYYDNPTAPTSIQLCDSTCTALNASSGAIVDLVLACSTSG